MNPITRNSRTRITTIGIAFVFGLTLFSTPAYSQGGFSGPIRGGGHHIHGGHGWLLLPALFTTALLASVAYSASSAPAPAQTVVVSRPAPVLVTAAPAQPISSGAVVVTANLLNVRSGPSRGEPCIQQLPNGSVLSVRGTAPGWYYVKTPTNQYGWVMTEFTAPAAPPANG